MELDTNKDIEFSANRAKGIQMMAILLVAAMPKSYKLYQSKI